MKSVSSSKVVQRVGPRPASVQKSQEFSLKNPEKRARAGVQASALERLLAKRDAARAKEAQLSARLVEVDQELAEERDKATEGKIQANKSEMLLEHFYTIRKYLTTTRKCLPT